MTGIIPSIPTDIYRTIAEEVAYAGTLKSLRLTSRAFCSEATRVLFHNVHLDDTTQPQFHLLISNRLHLAPIVKVMEIRLTVPGVVLYPWISSFLAKFSNLRELNLSARNDMAEPILSQLACIDTHLDLHNFSCSFEVSMPLLRFLGTQPSLRHWGALNYSGLPSGLEFPTDFPPHLSRLEAPASVIQAVAEKRCITHIRTQASGGVLVHPPTAFGRELKSLSLTDANSHGIELWALFFRSLLIRGPKIKFLELSVSTDSMVRCWHLYLFF